MSYLIIVLELSFNYLPLSNTMPYHRMQVKGRQRIKAKDKDCLKIIMSHLNLILSLKMSSYYKLVNLFTFIIKVISSKYSIIEWNSFLILFGRQDLQTNKILSCIYCWLFTWLKLLLHINALKCVMLRSIYNFIMELYSWS